MLLNAGARIGGAARRLFSALVTDILIPIITFFLPRDRAESGVDACLISWDFGYFLALIIDFMFIDLVIFIMMKQLEKRH
jgi:large-conductance mechanosensitive channel